MHNRARETLEQRQARKAANIPKVEKYVKLSKVVLDNHRQKKYDEEAFALSAKLLELNPEVATVWNYRRLYLLAVGPSITDVDKATALLEEELRLIERALKKNPKSYGAWHHRKWVVSQGKSDIQRELVLCGRLLDLDSRNFHCWSYRRFMAELANRTVEEELDFTTEKIEQNFSNYSAWHYRTRLLPQLQHTTHSHTADTPGVCHSDNPSPSSAPIPGEAQEMKEKEEEEEEGMLSSALPLKRLPVMYPPTPTSTPMLGRDDTSAAAPSCPSPGGAVPSTGGAVPVHMLQQELDLVKQAVFTEPADQSPWLYHRWTLSQLPSGCDEEKTAALVRDVVSGEVTCVRELLELEPDAKWPLLTLARLLNTTVTLLQGEGVGSDQGEEERSEVKSLYTKLMDTDKYRQQYYRDVMNNTSQ